MCGIVGVVGHSPVNQLLYDSLILLQHRGQDAAGITTYDHEGRIFSRKSLGLVRDVFQNHHMLRLQGNAGIGHVRYPTAGRAMSSAEAQPFYVNSPFGIALGHNGNLVNADELKAQLFAEDKRHINTNSDSEILLNVFAHELNKHSLAELTAEDVFYAVAGVHRRVRGGYSVVALVAGRGIVAFRDPHGIRPLVYGKRLHEKGAEYMVASESVALEANGFQPVRDLLPGEAIFINNEGKVWTRPCAVHASPAHCIFEYVYFARPDSVIDGVSVHRARMHMGEKLARKILREWPDHDIDVVIPIPDTSRTSALELATHLKVHYREGFIKNRYIAPQIRAAETESDLDRVRRQERAAGRRLHRARHHFAADHPDDPRRRRAQGLHGLGRAAGAPPQRVRHRHAGSERIRGAQPLYRRDREGDRRRPPDLPGSR
jgi:amidophosphoribosyltransferase